MSTLARFTAITERTRLSEFCPVLAEEGGLFKMEDGHIGRVYVASAISGASEKTQATLETMLELDFPVGTVIQWQNWNMGGASETVRLWGRDRREVSGGNVQAASYDAKIEEAFQRHAKVAPLRNGRVATNRFLVLTIKIPADDEIDKMPEQLRALESLMTQYVEGVASTGAFFKSINAQAYLNLIHNIFSPDEPTGPEYNDRRYINEQIDAPGCRVLHDQKHGLHVRRNIGGKTTRSFIGILSVAKWPKRMSLGLMNHLIGDPVGIQNQIVVPSILSTTIKFYDRASGLAMVKRRASATAFSTAGALLRWMPALAAKADGFQVVLASVEGDRKRVVGAATSLLLFSRSSRILDRAKGIVLGHWGSMGLVAGAESFIAFPAFWSHVPLWASFKGTVNLDRHHTMSSVHAAQILPVFGDWVGTTAPSQPGHLNGSLFLTRRGEPASYNVFSPAHSNANWVMIAQPGGGKSFAAQMMIGNQLALGTRVWVIDVGRSYLKQAAALNGEFRVFNDNSGICLNPFTHVKIIQDDLPTLSTIIATMCDSSGAMFGGERGALYRSTIAEAINSQWTVMSNALTPDHIYRFLRAQEDEISQNLSATLFPFSRQGPYGRWFNGVNNLTMNNQYTVLELEELRRQPHLQSVVLQMLMLQISQELYGNESQRKMVVIDESLDLVRDPMMADFFNEAFQKYRKYGGSIGLVAQDLIRLQESPVGHSVRANAYTFFLLEQKTATVMKLQNDKYFDLDEFGWNELRSLHTVRGQYSEVMVVTDAGNGVFRIVLPRELQLLFSSDETERKSIFDAMEAGQSVADVIARRVEAEARQVVDAAAAAQEERATNRDSFAMTGGLASRPVSHTRLATPDDPHVDSPRELDSDTGALTRPDALSKKPSRARAPRRWSLIAAAALIPMTVIVIVAVVALYAPDMARLWAKDTPAATASVVSASAATTPLAPTPAPTSAPASDPDLTADAPTSPTLPAPALPSRPAADATTPPSATNPQNQ